jgi:tRNA pseudouridine-54 N-methylase
MSLDNELKLNSIELLSSSLNIAIICSWAFTLVRTCKKCEALWNELIHNLAGIVKGGRPIKRIKVTRYDVLFIIFPFADHTKFSKEQLNIIQHEYKKYKE